MQCLFGMTASFELTEDIEEHVYHGQRVNPSNRFNKGLFYILLFVFVYLIPLIE